MALNTSLDPRTMRLSKKKIPPHTQTQRNGIVVRVFTTRNQAQNGTPRSRLKLHRRRDATASEAVVLACARAMIAATKNAAAPRDCKVDTMTSMKGYFESEFSTTEKSGVVKVMMSAVANPSRPLRVIALMIARGTTEAALWISSAM